MLVLSVNGTNSRQKALVLKVRATALLSLRDLVLWPISDTTVADW
jgi:hypothetical protein